METAAVGKANTDFLEGSSSIPAFDAFLDEYYGYGGMFLRETKKMMYPVVSDFMQVVHGDALEAVSSLPGAVPREEAFIRRYVYDYALRHASSSKRQLLKLVRDAGVPKMGKIKEQVSVRAITQYTDLPAEAVAERIAQWKLRRARVVAMNESVRESNAMIRETSRQSGVTKLQWRAKGTSCPFCTKLDGKIVGIRQPFLTDGEVLTVEGTGGAPQG